MGLRELAAADHRAIVEDRTGGFGWPVSVTDPNGVTAALVGLETDIGYFIDPDTGQGVSGRKSAIRLTLAALSEAGLGIPRGIADGTSRPWLVSFVDIVSGATLTWKVARSMPDRAIGAVDLILESYET